MEEAEERVSLCSVLESTVTVSEDGGSEDRLRSDACLGQVQTKQSMSEGSVGGERAGGTCNGGAENPTVGAARDTDFAEGLSCTESDNQNLKSETVCVSAQTDTEVASLESSALLDFNASSSVLVQKDQLVDVEQVRLNFAHQIKEKEPEEEVDNIGFVTRDEMSLSQPIQIHMGSVAAIVDENISQNPDVEHSSEISKKVELEIESDCTEQVDFDMVDAKEDKSTADEYSQANMKYGQEIEVEHDTNIEQSGFHAGKETEVTEVTDDKPKNIEGDFAEQEGLEPGISIRANQARYHMPAENESEFYVSDLVWGKVRSHPWWPGQIFDPSDSSEKAMKHRKKDCFFVAYFGDQTFAWNETAFLKPFRTHFSNMELQSSSEAFQNAVDCALKEVSRRTELGLACCCVPKDVYDKIRFQIVENAGIREESSIRVRAETTASTVTFEADKLINYLKELAEFPTGGSDRLELVIAKTQLAAFNNFRGYCRLPKFQVCGDLVENGEDPLENEVPAQEFIRHSSLALDGVELHSSNHEILKGQNGILYTNKKERSLSELMGGTLDSQNNDSLTDRKIGSVVVSSSLGKKRKAIDYYTDDSTAEGRQPSAKVSKVISAKQSFKIGDCIRRAASQMTGNTFVKVNSEKSHKGDGSIAEHIGDGFDLILQNFEDDQRGKALTPILTECSSLDELLSQLQLAAQDPLKECSFPSIVVSFFSDFRDSISLRSQNGTESLASAKVSGKRKKSYHNLSPEIFEFEDMSDTYWTDRVIENGAEGQPLRKNRKRDNQLMLAESEKSPQMGRRPHSRKRHSVANHDLSAEKVNNCADDRSIGELVMNFSEVDSVPSEMTLTKMFRRFGPLRESETEVDREGGRARVVFKNRSDAEVAISSAGKFNIFGQRLVNYQLNYTPSVMFKTPPTPRVHDQELHLDFSSSQYHEMQLDLTSIHHEMQLDLASLDDHEMQLDLSTIQYPEMEPILFPAELEDMQANLSLVHCEEKQPDVSSFQEQEKQHGFATSNDFKSQTTHVIMLDRSMEPDCSTPGNQYTELEFTRNEEEGINRESIMTEDQRMNHELTSTEGQNMNPDPTILKDEEMISCGIKTDEHDIIPDYATENREMNSEPTPSEDEEMISRRTKTDEHDMIPDYATENQDMNSETTPSEDEGMIPDLTTTDDKVRNPDLIATETLDPNSNLTTTSDQDMKCDFTPCEDQDANPDLISVEDKETKPDIITPTGVQDMEPDHTTILGHDMKPDQVTVEVHKLKHDLIIIQDKDIEPDLVIIENKDVKPDLPKCQDLENESGPSTVENQQIESCHATTLEIDAHPDKTAMKKHDSEMDHVTIQNLDLHSVHATIQEQDVHDPEIKQDGDNQVDCEISEQEIESDISPTPNPESLSDSTKQSEEM